MKKLNVFVVIIAALSASFLIVSVLELITPNIMGEGIVNSIIKEHSLSTGIAFLYILFLFVVGVWNFMFSLWDCILEHENRIYHS